MTAQSVCQYEKFGICKRKQECDFFHPTLVCDDQNCTIKLCRKRHPLICRYYASVGHCRFNEACKFDHKKVDEMKSYKSQMNAMEIKMKSKIDILEKNYKNELTALQNTYESRLLNMKQDYETKLNDMERRFLLLISENERKHQFSHEDIQIICKNNERVIDVLKEHIKMMNDEMLHHMKDQGDMEEDDNDSEVECTRTQGDVKRKCMEEDDIDSDNKKNKIEKTEGKSIDQLETLLEECQERLENLEDTTKSIKKKDLEYHNLHKFAEFELKRTKIFILKEKMVEKNVEKVKEMIKKIGTSYETRARGMDSRTNVIIKIFKRIYKTMEDTPNIKYKSIVKNEIDQLINICEKEQKVSKN